MKQNNNEKKINIEGFGDTMKKLYYFIIDPIYNGQIINSLIIHDWIMKQDFSKELSIVIALKAERCIIRIYKSVLTRSKEQTLEIINGLYNDEKENI